MLWDDVRPDIPIGKIIAQGQKSGGSHRMRASPNVAMLEMVRSDTLEPLKTGW